MKKLSKDVWLLIGLLVFLIIASVFLGKGSDGESGMEMIPRATTYSSKPGGVKALYQTLDKLGYPVNRKITELSAEPPDGVLFILSPQTSPSRNEWLAVKRWVERGNVLIVSSPGDVIYAPDGKSQKVDQIVPACPSFLAPDVRSQATLEQLRITQEMMSLDDLARFVKPFG